MINATMADVEIKAGTKTDAFPMVTIMDPTTKKVVPVKDIAKQCPGYKTAMKCTAMAGRRLHARKLAECKCTGAKPCKHNANHLCLARHTGSQSHMCPTGSTDCNPSPCPCPASKPCAHNAKGNNTCYKTLKLHGKVICNAGTTHQGSADVCKAKAEAKEALTKYMAGTPALAYDAKTGIASARAPKEFKRAVH